MSHSARRVKIGQLYDGSSCCWCSDLLFFGDDGVICEVCGSPSHTRCWDKVNRCNACNTAPTYINQPLPPPPVQVAQRPGRTLAVGENFCATCGDVVSGYCFRCSNLYPQPLYTGKKMMLPEAKQALYCALFGLLCFGFVLGPIAIMKGRSAKEQIAADPRWDGESTATAAQIIGAIEIGLFILWILGAVLRS